jgi:hypothetical protein
VTRAELEQRMLELRGIKSNGAIARELGVSRSTVAGVFFRHDWPEHQRVSYPWSERRNLCGWGNHGWGAPHAPINLYPMRKLAEGECPPAGP